MVNTEEVFHMTGHELLRRRGKVATQALFNQMMGRRAREAFAAMIEMMELSDTVDDLQAESESIFDGLLVTKLRMMPGLLELLDHIEASHLPKGVATSSDRVYMQRMLNHFDLLHRFSMHLTAEDVTHGKPNPEIYLTAAQRMGVQPHEMLVLEDSHNGTKAAAAAGAHIVSVPHEHSSHHDFSVAKHVATSLVDPVILKLIGVK